MTTQEMTRIDLTPPATLLGLRNKAMFVALVAGVATVIGAFTNFDQFLRGYLIGYIWILGFSLGSLALLMTGHLSGGNWWMLGRRVFEAATRCLPMLAVLFLPVLLGAKHIFGWMSLQPSQDKVFAEKVWWLNYHGWVVRAIIYFVLWIGLELLLNRLSARQDEDADPKIWQRMKAISGAGLLIWAWSLTGASVDWGMSLDTHWFSTIYGMLWMIGEALSALSLLILMLSWMSEDSLTLREVVRPDRLHDLGKLLLAFTMVWAYFSFSQWLIIWMGNLPEEIAWYLHRIKSGWGYVALLLIVGQFALPFALLLSRNLKRHAKRLVPVAVLVIVMRAVDLYWYVVPNGLPGQEPPHFTLHWTFIVAPIALVSLWLAAFSAYLSKRPLLVRNEPMLPRLWEQSHGH